MVSSGRKSRCNRQQFFNKWQNPLFQRSESGASEICFVGGVASFSPSLIRAVPYAVLQLCCYQRWLCKEAMQERLSVCGASVCAAVHTAQLFVPSLRKLLHMLEVQVKPVDSYVLARVGWGSSILLRLHNYVYCQRSDLKLNRLNDVN